jgi:hypothetical protein
MISKSIAMALSRRRNVNKICTRMNSSLFKISQKKKDHDYCVNLVETRDKEGYCEFDK